MINLYFYGLISVLAISLVSLVGVFTLSLRTDLLKKYVFIFISLAIGALLGDAFIHLIPEALEESQNATLTSALIIAGIIIFLIMEKFLHWHHHGEDTEENHIHPVGKLSLISDGVHNFLDGIIIGASFLVSIPLGIATSLAVLLHEIPQEIGDFAVLIHSGYTKKRALWLNFLSACLSILGLGLAFLLGDIAEQWAFYFVPIAAGGFIYIALADLIPEIHKTKNTQHSIIQVLGIILGVGIMIALTFLE